LMQTIFYSPQLRSLWPSELPRRWRSVYPQVFDNDDLRQIAKQPEHHFFEWYLAVHLFQRYGVLSLVEKAQYIGSHPRKKLVVESLMPKATFDRLSNICGDCGVQWPDLLCYRPGRKGFFFAEAKGPSDKLSDKQIESHRRIQKFLKASVRVFALRPLSVAT